MSVDSDQTFTTEQLVEYSKTVLVEMPCDWGNCPAVLNCWDNVAKHMNLHVQKQVRRANRAQSPGQFTCNVRSCPGRRHDSFRELKVHVEANHLSRIYVPCPILGCPETCLVSRHKYTIANHLEQDHSNLTRNGHFVAVLKPTFHPTGALSLSFPQQCNPGCFTPPVPTLPVTPHPLARLHSAPHHQQQSGYWSIPDPQEGLNPASDSALAPDHPDDSMELSDFIIQQRPREIYRLQLSHPLILPEGPVDASSPSPSIGYGVFCASHQSEPHDFT